MKKPRNPNSVLALVLLCAVGWAPTVMAKDPFVIDINNQTDGILGQLGFSSLDEAIGELDGTGRLQQVAGYDGSEMAIVNFDLRGLGIVITFPNGGGDPQLILQIPGLVINPDRTGESPSDTVVFFGNTRADSVEQLKDFLKNNKFALKAILTELARSSPIDPLAGNPLSLMTQKMTGDFRDGFTHKVSQIWGCNTSAFNLNNDAPIMVAALGATSDIFAEAQARSVALASANEIGMGLTYASTEADGYRSTGISLPLSYTAKLDSLKGHKLRFDLPLAYVDTEGATTYAVGLGVAYTYPMSDVWTLTPGLGIGATGSEDLGSAGGVRSMSVTSAYTWRVGDYALSMGNGIGQYASLPIKIGDVEAEADITNTVFSNGLLLSGPNSLIARNMVVEYSIQDTRLTGDDVYSKSYDEFGIALGYIDTEMGIIDNFFKGGVSYMIGENDIKAFKLNLSARF